MKQKYILHALSAIKNFHTICRLDTEAEVKNVQNVVIKIQENSIMIRNDKLDKLDVVDVEQSLEPDSCYNCATLCWWAGEHLDRNGVDIRGERGFTVCGGHSRVPIKDHDFGEGEEHTK